MAAIGGLLFWLALPPVDFGPLAFVAPIPWIWLIEQPELSGKRPYLQIWLASFLFWLTALHWLTLPHWATSFGWVLLSFYLAFYLPAFVGLSRVCVQRWKATSLIAVPIVWVGLELVQSYLLTGFTMVLLGQTQYRWIAFNQIADLTGTFGISFVIMVVAACLARMAPRDGRRFAVWPLLPATALLAAVLAYGWWRTSGDYLSDGPTVALIQGDIDTEMKADPSRNEQVFREYGRLTMDALRLSKQLDLIVWPETMFRYSWFTFSDDYRSKNGEAFTPEQLMSASRQAVENVVLPVGTPMLLGIDRWHHTADGTLRYNAALFVDRYAEVLGLYGKTHLVMFGEYVPFARRFPFLQKLTPLPASSEAGEGGIAVESKGVCYCPSICFETTLARVMRQLVNEARESRNSCDPQVLVNLTNDGWFWGSAELDMHLICGVFRAIECRKPLLIAANTGFSAWIDSDGRIVQQAKRRAEDVIIARPELDTRRSFYLNYGDVFALTCFAITAVAAGYGILNCYRTRVARASATPAAT
jgi:apolipoprotein N-acyltransferase